MIELSTIDSFSPLRVTHGGLEGSIRRNKTIEKSGHYGIRL